MISALTEGFEDEDIPSVTVDISATDASLAKEDAPDATSEEADAPPSDEEFAEESVEEEPAPAPEPEGVTIHVEPGRDGSAKVDADAVKFLAPFPAKPLFQAPVGWRLEHPGDVPAFVEKVQLANGTNISLSIRPHLLVPDADGQNVLAVNEPGYEPALRYAQTGTMSAILSESADRMEEDSLKMSEALDRLGQLLSSLPAAPEAPPCQGNFTRQKAAMKSNLVPFACGTALALMAGAAGSHWFSVRDMATLAAVLPSDLAPAKARPATPLSKPDDGLAKETRNAIAEARRNLATPQAKPTAPTTAPASDADRRIEKLLTLLEGTEERNQELLDQIAGTNRDLQELRFQVDMYDGQFRPLKVEEEPAIYDDGSSGVLPPIE